MKRTATMLVGLALAVAPATASAQSSSTCQAYNPELCDVTGNTAGTSEGTLPFTGLDVGLLAIAGGALVGAGVIVRPRGDKLN
jgi:hypothetical protein